MKKGINKSILFYISNFQFYKLEFTLTNIFQTLYDYQSGLL